MAIFLKPDRWKIRGRKGNFTWGETYAFGCEVQRVTDDLAVLVGLIGVMHKTARTEIGIALKSLGFKTVIWEDAEGREHRQNLRRF